MIQNRTHLSWPLARADRRPDGARPASPTPAWPGGDVAGGGSAPVVTPPATPAPGGPQDPVAPAAESWRRRLARRAIDFWLRALFAATERFPGALRGLQRPLVGIGFAACPQVRAAMLANAARILGPASSAADRRRLAHRVLRSFYLFCLDVGRSTGMSAEQLRGEINVVEGRPHHVAARAMGKGLIVVTAHMGSFEVGLAALAEYEKRIHVIFQRDAQGGFERQRSGLRERLNVREAPVDDGWTMWIRLRDALLAGDAVVFQGDRVMPGQRGKRLPFLHGTLEVPTGPVKLARITGSPILPIFTARDPDGSIRVIIEPPITLADDVAADHPTTGRSADPLLAKLAAVIEKQVAAHADQWLMIHRAFCEDQ